NEERLAPEIGHRIPLLLCGSERLGLELHQWLGAGGDAGEERVGLGQHARHVETRGSELRLVEERFLTALTAERHLGNARPEIAHGNETEGAQILARRGARL